MRSLLLSFLFLAVCFTCSESITVMSIDLGTEWMKIAIVKPGVPMEIVLNKETKRKTEVAVAMKDGERLFGSAAVSQGIRFPKSTYFYLLDLLAKKMDNPLVQLYKKKFPYYDLEENPDTGYVQFRHDEDTTYSPEELLAMTLNYSRSLAEDFAGQPVDTCVITVPSYFNQAERHMLLYATKLAGLKGAQLMDDNVASALNYGVFRRNDINASASYIMFYDMGATSTTATIIAYQVVKVNGVADPQLSVKGVGFDRSFGGLEMEMRLREHLIKLFNENKKTKSDVRKSPRAMAKLLKEATRLKKVLSANMEHKAQIEGLIDDEDFKAKVTREEFEELCSDLWPRVAVPMKEALDSASLTMDLISKIILVGGGTRVPKVQEILLKESGKSELGRSLNTDEAPALGASYEAAARSNAFRVKTFHVKLGTIYPIDIEFDRITENEDGSQHVKHVRKTLFQRNNPYPQRKVITFNRFYSDFGFSINYGDLSYLDKEELKIFGVRNISSVRLQGVDVAHEKYGNDNETESKGVKAHFRMDENGILNLEEVESVYEANATTSENATVDGADEDPSTFQKLKDSFSSLFGGGEDGKADETGEKSKSEEPKGEEGKTEEKATESTQEEKKTEDEQAKDDSGSEEGQPKKDEKPEEKTKEETSKDSSKAEEDSSQMNKTEKVEQTEKKKENATKEAETVKKPKKIKHSVSLNKTVERHDFTENSEATYNASKKRLKVLAERDALKAAREEAMNNLEAYIYDKQDKLYQEEYEKAMTTDEQEQIPKALTEASDWMFDLEDEPEPQVYRDKLKDLKKVTRPWLLRVKERQECPQLLKDMEIIFNYTKHFITAIDSLSEDDQIYTEVEINLLKTTFNNTVNWKNDTVKKQDALEPFADNIMKPDDIKMKIAELNREVQYLLNKARTAKPKKKTTDSKTNSTKTEQDKTKNGTETTVETDDKNNTKTEEKPKGKDDSAEEKKEEGGEVDKQGTTEKEKEEKAENLDETTTDSTEPKLELPPSEDEVTTSSEAPTKDTSTSEETTTTKEPRSEEGEKQEL